MKKILASLTAGAMLVGAGFAFSAVSTPEVATAQTITDEGATDDSTVEETTTPRATFLDDVLDDLVEDGTLTRAQADTVKERIQARMGEFPGKGFRHGAKIGLETAAEVLGTTVDELLEALKGGQTLAAIAGDQVDELIAAMVETAEARIDEAVADGKLTVEEGEERKAELEAKITDHVENGPDEDGFRGRGHRGHRGGPGGGPGNFGNQNGPSSVEGVDA